MHMTKRTRQISRLVSDGTGLSEDEIGLLIATAALLTAVLGVLRAVDLVLDAWPQAQLSTSLSQPSPTALATPRS